MITVEILAFTIIVALIMSWRITWLATRVDRANVRAERTWAALDAALVRRASRALELVLIPDIDAATALLVSEAANAALEPNLSRRDRERAESDLSNVLDAIGPMLPAGSSPSELVPVSVAGCTTMQWLPSCRCGVDTLYESCSWQGGRQHLDPSKWQTGQSAL